REMLPTEKSAPWSKVRQLFVPKLVSNHGVMAGLVPAIHVFENGKSWMPGIKPGTTIERTIDVRQIVSNIARRLLSAAGMAYRRRSLIEDGAARKDGRPLAG